MTGQIQYLQRQKIDISKWDRCITISGNGLIYGYSWWLDEMAENWDALVLNDYEAVMPLAWREKYAFKYLYHPPFTACLGVFGNMDHHGIVTDFLQSIPQQFRFWDIDLNEANKEINNNRHFFQSSFRINQMLSLAKSRDEIREGYSRLARRSLVRAAAAKLHIQKEISVQDVVELYRSEYEQRHKNIKSADYLSLIKACIQASEKGYLKSYLALSPEEEPVAFYCVLQGSKFVYSLIGGSSAAGKESGAFYLLTDAAITDHAGSNRVFRFEGSDIPGIAFFNQQFGASPVSYLHIKMNRLPFPVNLLK